MKLTARFAFGARFQHHGGVCRRADRRARRSQCVTLLGQACGYRVEAGRLALLDVDGNESLILEAAQRWLT
jgi:hypothetical protein